MRFALPPVLLFASISAFAQNVTVIDVDPNPAVWGQRVIISVRADEELTLPTVILRTPSPGPDKEGKLMARIRAMRTSSSGDAQAYAFTVPNYLPFGTYDIGLQFTTSEGQAEVPISGAERLRVGLKQAPTISAIHPGVLYPDDAQNSLTIVGEGFSPDPTSHTLILNGQVIPPCTKERPKKCVTASLTADGHALQFAGVPLAASLNGPQAVQLLVDGRYATIEKPFILSWARRGTPLRIAFLVTLGFLLLILMPVFFAPGQQTWVGRGHSALRSILLDSQTNTYSLSKFQFYAWTIAAVFGYVYLTACKSLVQGQFAFADIPSNLPGILLVSIGTSTIALGVSGARPKGAGGPNPSIADFLTTGGIVVPERVQFFTWTMLGVAAFIFLVSSSDPGTISELPPIPEGFLVLMGISSAGYLGGKLARDPGPIITSASIKNTNSVLIDISGRNLAADATLYLGETVIPRSWIQEMKPRIVEADEKSGFAKQLEVILNDASLSVANPVSDDLQSSRTTDAKTVQKVRVNLPGNQFEEGSPLRLRIVNPDGQKAEYELTPITDAV